MVSRSTLLIWSICSLGTMLGGIKVRAGPLYCLLFCTRYRIMVLLTLNKKDLWMREAVLREFQWFVQKGRGSWIKGLWPPKGLSFLLYLDIRVRVHPSLEVSPSHQSEDPRNQNWKEALEAILLKAPSQALGILLLNFFFTEGFVDLVAPAASTCQPPSRVSFAQARAFLVCLINSKVIIPYYASSTWRLSCIFIKST